jgi:hypothetical protein
VGLRAVLVLAAALAARDAALAVDLDAAPVPVVTAEGATAAAPGVTDRVRESNASHRDITRPRLSRLQPSHADQVNETAVRRLTRILELDAGQQVRLREILDNQRRQIRKVWADTAGYGSDRVTPTRAVLERTREEIRAMLNEEQRKKYPAAIPQEGLAPARADVEHWIDLTQPGAPQRAGPAN